MKNTGRAFELAVKSYFEQELKQSFGYDVEVFHRKKYDLPDGGKVEIDLSYDFEVAGLKLLVLIECKDWNTVVDRDQVLTLSSKLNELNAHKGVVVSARGFQKGAVTFAERKKIGLLKVSEDKGFETTTNFTGTDLGKLKESLESNSEEIQSSRGFTSPTIDVLEYIAKIYKPDTLVFLAGQLLVMYEDENSFDLDNVSNEIIEDLKRVDPNWISDYQTSENCGLNLSLTNEYEIRLLNIVVTTLTFDRNNSSN